MARAVGVGLINLSEMIAGLFGPHVYMEDLVNTYLLARATGARIDPYQPMSHLARIFIGPSPVALFTHATPHPPTLGLLALPLAVFDYRTAAALWFCVSLVLYYMSLELLRRRARIDRWKPWLWPLVLIAALSLVPVADDLKLGQPTMILLVVLIMTWRALDSGNAFQAGAWLALSLLVKQLAWPVLILLLVGRQWKAASFAVGSTLAGYSVAVVVFGPATMWRYLSQILPQVTAIYRTSAFNLSIASFAFPRLYSETIGSLTFPDRAVPFGAVLIGAALTTMAVGAAILMMRMSPRSDPAYALAIALSTIVNPISWQFYQVLLLIPATVVIRWLGKHGYPWRETSAAMVILLWLSAYAVQWQHLAFNVAGRLPPQQGQAAELDYLPGLIALGPLYGVVALLLLLSWMIWKDRRSEAQASSSVSGQT
jgi:hypothetical protein